MSFLTLRNIGVRYGATTALDAVGLDVEHGMRLAVIGPSGSGKSTLLRVLAGFEAPQSGQVCLDGALIVDGPRIVPPHRRGVGLVAQEGALFPHLSVADNIGFGVPRRQAGRQDRIAELAALVGLDTAMLARRPDALSGGQQQRVAIARSLACQPRLMLLDEPFSALDADLRAETRTAVAELLGRAGVTTVLVTHDQEEALSFSHQVAVLRQGRLLQVGTPRELYLEPASEEVARSMGAAIILPGQLSHGFAECALGRVAAKGGETGRCRIMLRHEQVVVSTGDRGVAARVAGVAFAGGFCTVDLVLTCGTALRLRTPQNAAPPQGASVRVEVVGTAHCWPTR